MVNAQDKALATLCIERGHLDDDAVERARQAHAELMERGEPAPLGNLLVQKGFLDPKVAASLLRELALARFLCPRCERGWTYEELARLTRYRCEGCGERLVRRSRSTRSSVATVPAEATEVDRRRISSRRFSSAPPPVPGVRNTAVSINIPKILPASGVGGRPTSALRPSDRSSAASAPPHPPPPAEPAIAASSPAPQVSGPGVASPAAPGARMLGPYEILSELGRGAMGVVYLGRRPGLERLFAIKVLLGGALADAEDVERFRREAALASRIQHPNVVPVYDVGVAAGYHYYVMEHCPGRTLKQVLEERKRFPDEEAAALVAKIGRGLAAAHDLGVVHRDVKPANVLLEARTGTPRVADFGLARDASQADTGVTRTGDVIGTPSYMAPEQLVGKRGVDARADVYALGVVLYELLAGVRPFVAQTTAELTAKVLSEDARPLRSVLPDVAPPLDAVVSKAIEKAPERRYANARELADDLDRFLAGEPVLARPEGTLHRVWRRSKRTILAAALLVAALASLGGFVGLVHRRELERERAAELAKLAIATESTLKVLERDALTGKDLEELERDWTALAKTAPPTHQALVLTSWADCLMRRGRPAAAFAVAQAHVGADGRPGLVARRIVADVLLDRNARGEAEPLLVALEQCGQPPFADWARLRRMGELGGSVLVPEELEKKIATASPGDPWSLRLLAQLERRAGNAKVAGELLEKAFLATSVDRAASDDARAHLESAIQARARYAQPVFDLLTATDKEPRAEVALYWKLAGDEAENDPEALVERARNEVAAFEMSRAIRDLDVALDRGFDGVEALALRGLFGDARGRASAAKAKERGARDPGIEWYLWARFQVETAVDPDVRAHFVKVAATAEAPAREALVAALAKSAAGEPLAEVEKAFEAAQKLAPRCPIVAREAARALVSRGQTDRAVQALQAARDLPGAPSGELRLLEAEAYLRRGLRAEASDVAQRLAESSRDGPWGPLADCLVALIAGDAERALERSKLALERDRENATALRYQARALSLGDDKEAALDTVRQVEALEANLDSNTGLLLLQLETTPITRGGRGGGDRDRGGGDRGGGDRGGRGGWERLQERFDAWEHYVERYSSAEHHYSAAKSYIDQVRASRDAMEAREREGGGGNRGFGGELTRGLTKAAHDHLTLARTADARSPLGAEGLGIAALYVDRAPSNEVVEIFRNALSVAPRWRPPIWLERELRRDRPEVLEALSPKK